VLFDLTTETKIDKKNASGFRNNLLKYGFLMMQYSVYIRHYARIESADAHKKRINKLVPALGKVSVL
jgi:CRISPR-associated protein Cas2